MCFHFMFTQAAALKLLAEYQAEIRVWEEEWDMKADENRDKDIEAGLL